MVMYRVAYLFGMDDTGPVYHTMLTDSEEALQDLDSQEGLVTVVRDSDWNAIEVEAPRMIISIQRMALILEEIGSEEEARQLIEAVSEAVMNFPKARWFFWLEVS